jgi:hypothetical protein
MTPTRLSPSRSSCRSHRFDRSGRRLGSYTDAADRQRELVAERSRAGGVLVLDRDSRTRGDARLLAHLGADEPPESAAAICADYLRDEHVERRRPRRVTAEDARTPPLPDVFGCSRSDARRGVDGEPVDRFGRVYRLELIDTGMSIPELRWCRRESSAPSKPISLRRGVASLESYEPLCSATGEALALAAGDGDISSAVLRAELARVLESPIVLNRALREAVVVRVERDEVSMSEIAVRCGRMKRDGRGNVSGETSWLARRIGLLPDGGQESPTPWIHSDVLGLIARRGLGISPREVEL